MKEYFGIKYEFDKDAVFQLIDKQCERQKAAYVCVADGVVLSFVQNTPEFKKVLDESYFSVCDSGYVPLYLKWLYDVQVEQLSGTELMKKALQMKSYTSAFVGGSKETLALLQEELIKLDPAISEMNFIELPYCDVDHFDYPQIANEINKTSPDLIWVSLGAPKQCYFMNRLTPYLNKGVLLGVGAAFNFLSGSTTTKRAPIWMIKFKMEWVYRLMKEPSKQFNRILLILKVTPPLLWKEYRKLNQQ